jgi:hypothetical protein
VLAYWHDHYDLTAILKRDWPTLGPKLEGKLHLAVGDGDTYFLNNAVHLLQKDTGCRRSSPHSDASFQYGPGMPHCYTGGPSRVHHAAEQRQLGAAGASADDRAHAGDCAGGGGCEVVEILKLVAPIRL